MTRQNLQMVIGAKFRLITKNYPVLLSRTTAAI